MPTPFLRSLFEPVTEGGGRLSGLDGLRGLTMLMVIFCHLQLLRMGWVGLQSFFVLSGFLITRVLLSDQRNATSFGDYLKRFYLRRALRILPLYYAYLTLLGLGGFLLPSLAKVHEQLPYAYFYVFNLYQAAAAPEHTRTLVHLWSLSVEEQFYLFWPLVIALIPPRHLKAAALLLVLAGPFLRLAVYQYWPLGGLLSAPSVLSVYALTTSHLDAFALGALINFVSYRPQRWQLLLTVGLGLAIGIAVNGLGPIPGRPHDHILSLGWPLYMPQGYQFVWGYSLVNLFWFQVICAILHGGLLKRFFCSRILDFLGKRSYSTYIVHYPLLGFSYHWWAASVRYFDGYLGTLVFFVPFMAVVTIIASLSYRYLELPALALKERFASPKRLVTSAAAADRGGLGSKAD